MNYYKVILQNKIIDVLKDVTWVRVNKNGLLVSCEAKDAAGVVSSNCETVWHIVGMPTIGDGYEDVSVIDIDETEANTLSELLGLGGDVSQGDTGIDVGWDEEPVEEQHIDTTNLDKVKEHYIEKLSAICQQEIFAGVDVELGDGVVKHFDLEIEDQVNLLSMAALMANGETVLPYHASGELCEFYTAEDMMKIISAATMLKTYHTTYFNSLKNWVLSMTTIDEVCAVRYGDAIPDEYCSDILKQMMAGDVHDEAI